MKSPRDSSRVIPWALILLLVIPSNAPARDWCPDIDAFCDTRRPTVQIRSGSGDWCPDIDNYCNSGVRVSETKKSSYDWCPEKDSFCDGHGSSSQNGRPADQGPQYNAQSNTDSDSFLQKAFEIGIGILFLGLAAKGIADQQPSINTTQSSYPGIPGGGYGPSVLGSPSSAQPSRGFQTRDSFGNLVNSNDSYQTRDSFGNLVNSRSSYQTKDSFGNIVNSQTPHQTKDAFGNIVNTGQ